VLGRVAEFTERTGAALLLELADEAAS